jgi:flagellar motor component MotA
MARFIIGVVLLLALVGGAVLLEGGDLLRLVAISAFIVVFFPAVFAALAVWKAGAIGEALRDALGRRAGPQAARSARILAFLERLFYITAVLGWLLGDILILSNLGNPGLSGAGLSRAMAAGCVGPLYGILFGIVARVLRTRAEGRVGVKA